MHTEPVTLKQCSKRGLAKWLQPEFKIQIPVQQKKKKKLKKEPSPGLPMKLSPVLELQKGQEMKKKKKGALPESKVGRLAEVLTVCSAQTLWTST
jgi:hypothetical protein